MVALERSSAVVTILKGSAPIADIALFTAGGVVQTNGIQVKLLEVTPDYKVAFNVIHDTGAPTILKFSHAEITVTRGAAPSLDNVLDTTGGATQTVAALLVDSTPTTDTYLVIVVNL